MEKILIINVHDECKIGGTQKYLKDLKQILKTNFTVDIKCIFWTGKGKKNKQCLFNKKYFNNPIGYIFAVIVYNIYIYMLMKKKNYSKVIANNNCFAFSLFKPKIEIISVQHNDVSKLIMSKSKFNIRRIMSAHYVANKIVCFDNKSIDLFFKNINSKAKYYSLPLYNREFRKISQNNSDKIVYIGRIDVNQKRIDILNDISKKLETKIDVIGQFNNNDKETYNNLNFLGQKNSNELLEELSKYKAVILTSDFEGLPFVFLEAMSCGVPIICRDTFITAKFLINNGLNGILIDKNKSATEIADIINNTNFNKFDRFKIQQFAKENFSYDNFIKVWNQVLR